MKVPKSINLENQDFLVITWEDDQITKYPLKYLRDESPDAGNKGETILWKHYEPLEKGPDKPGKYEIENIELVGNYAINIKWKDGYDYGIYPWSYLIELAENLQKNEKSS